MSPMPTSGARGRMVRVRVARARPVVPILVWIVLSLPSAAVAQTLTLDEAARSALANHPAVAVASARAEAAGEAAAAARASRLPAVSASAQLTRFQEPMVVAPLHAFDPTNPPSFDESLVQGRLALEYTLFDAGGRGSRVRAADASAEGAELGRDVAEMELLERVAAAYFRVLSARSVREAALAQVEAFQEERARARQAVDVGTAAEVEALRAAAALQDATAEASSAEARTDLAERALARLMGVEADRVIGRQLADLSPSGTAGPAPGSEAGQRGGVPTGPQVSRAQAAARAAEARLAEERAGRLPRISAAAGLLNFGTPRGEHVLEWQAGLQLSWPLFTGGARSAAIRGAGAEARAATAELALTELEVAQAIDAAMTAIAEADARAEALRTAVEQWTEVARIEALGLEAGAGVQSDLLSARASLFRASAGHAAARYEALLARVGLARAQGILDRDWLDEALETLP
jgi:outer membrane protein